MMLYQINDSTYAGAYIKLECIQSILPNYSIKDMEKYNLIPIDLLLKIGLSLYPTQLFYTQIGNCFAWMRKIIKI